MTSTEWHEWTDYHKLIFALRSDADAEMVSAWRDMLGHHSFAALRAASDELLKLGAEYRDKHVSALLRILDAGRRKRFDDFATQAEEGGEGRTGCEICHGRGLVDVPHPACVVDGDIVEGNFGGHHYFAKDVVYCSCPKGCRMHTRQVEASNEARAKKPREKHEYPMTLGQYEERVCVHWRDLLEEMARLQKERREAISKARGLDRRFGPLAKDMSKLTRKAAS